MLINTQHKLATVVHHDFRLIPIVSRFGIPFGFGDKTINLICEENAINPGFFIEILNAFHDKDYQPDKKLQSFSLKLIVDYLLKSHRYYNSTKIPRIELLINQLVWANVEREKNRPLLIRFFNEYRKEVEEHTFNEEQIIYPYVLEIERAFLAQKADEVLIEKIKTHSIRHYQGDHEELNTALFDLKNIVIKYLPPADNSDIIEQILTEVFRLEKDMKDHTRIEDKVLIPKVIEMESAILKF